MSAPVAPDPTVHDLTHIAARDKAEILAQALPYIRKFHGRPSSSSTAAMP